MSGPLLRLSGLSMEYASLWGRKRRVLDSVNMEVGAGETRGVIGVSGSGKSTLGRCSVGLSRPSSGSIAFDGIDLWTLSQSELRRRRREFQMVFQGAEAALNPGMTVEEILSEPLEIGGIGDRREREEEVRKTMAMVSLDESMLRRTSRELSGGQRQRVGIGRALMLRPRLLIADEPVSSLDASVQIQILNLLGDLKDKHGLTLVLISHSMSVVRYLCDRISVMDGGRIIEEGLAEAFFAAPKHPQSRRLLEAETGEKAAGGASWIEMRGRGLGAGCTFRSGCADPLPICSEEIPKLREVRPGEKVACFRYE